MVNLTKLSRFIDDIVKYRFDDIRVEVFIFGRKKIKTYSLEISTNVPKNNIGFSFGDQLLTFSISDDYGVSLNRDDYQDFYIQDELFAIKYFKIMEVLYYQKLNMNLDRIIDGSYNDLNLNREVNLDNLV